MDVIILFVVTALFCLNIYQGWQNIKLSRYIDELEEENDELANVGNSYKQRCNQLSSLLVVREPLAVKEPLK